MNDWTAEQREILFRYGCAHARTAASGGHNGPDGERRGQDHAVGCLPGDDSLPPRALLEKLILLKADVCRDAAARVVHVNTLYGRYLAREVATGGF